MPFARKNEVPLSQMKQRTASGMRALAGKIDDELPGMVAPHHLRDAARALESGNHAGAKRHLQSAMHTMTPLSLMRHGILDDDGHAKAKVAMDLINRHHMLVSDLEDGEAHNRNLHATPGTFTQPSNLPMGDSMNPLKLPGAAGPDGGPGVPKTVRAAMVPAPAQNTGTDRAMAGGPKAPSAKENRLPGRPMPQAVLSWEHIDRLIELSAQTGRLASTPAPRGRPGGPGLYDVKGMGHTDYLQQIVKALIRKGMDPSKAYAIARGAIRRWSAGGGKVHPEVRAAAGAAESGELARQAQAKAVHGHTADSWAGVVELVGTAAGAAADPRAANGTFGAGGSAAAPPPSAQNAAQKKQLLAKAAADRAQAAVLVKKLAALQAASKATTKATAAATKAGATGKSASPTPAKTTSAAPAVKKTTAAPAAAAKTGAAAAKKPTTKAQQVSALKTQISALLTQAAQATALAAKL